MLISARRFKAWPALGVAAGLALYWFMAASVSRHVGVTADEVVHLTGGYSYWKFNDYRLHPENGTLPMRIAALPWLAMDLKFPPRDTSEWHTSRVNHLGDVLFFQLGNPLDDMLARARMMIALVGAFSVWLTWRWAKGLFGPAAGWLALGLAVFCPALLAHGGLATSDIALTAFMLAALSLTWALLHRATWWRLGAAALVCGLTFLSKMSGVLLVPLVAGMVLVRWLRPVPFVLALGRVRWLRRRGQIMAATTLLTFAMAAGSLVTLWAAYGFRFEGLQRTGAGEDYYFSWDVILDKKPLPLPANTELAALIGTRPPQKQGGMSHLVGWLRERRLLPEAYLWGFGHTYKFSRYRPAYFMGEHRTTGWRSFFPVAFLLKTPLPALLLIAAGAAALAWNGTGERGQRFRAAKPWLYRSTPLLLFFAVYWMMAINMTLNIGHRHILPTYPIFYVFASASVLWLGVKARRAVALALLAAVSLHAADSLLVRPFYLSYFQPLVGGVTHGHRYLVDSSYDWGQGLPAFQQWLDEKKASGDQLPVFLSYFGADSPQGRGLQVTRFGDEITDWGARTYPAQVRGGWFVISATHFRRAYLPVRGPWTEREEILYREILARLAAAQENTRIRTAAETERLTHNLRDYEILQFARLTHYLENREPHAVIGGSLLAFKLTDEELAFALYAPRSELERRRDRR